MCPAACVMAMGGFAERMASCGVTPQAQKTGTSSGSMGIREPKTGGANVRDADRRRVSDMDGAAVYVREPLCDGNGVRDLAALDRAHADRDRSGERPRRFAGQVGVVNRAAFAVGAVFHGDPTGGQRVLKGKAAADQKADQIVTPETGDIRAFILELAVLEHAVAGQIRRDVRRVGQTRNAAGTGGEPLKNRAGLCVFAANCAKESA